jgi:2,4-dienoyl-CoA reductase-like NADH-dependent reductase (Old Yellow Enzyme family)
MACAANVQAVGKGFHGQRGIHDNRHLECLVRLAALIRAGGSVSSVQLHHKGQGTGDVHGVLAGPSRHIADNARVLSTAEVEQLRDDYIAAAQQADSAGFDGVEVHRAFGYVLAQFRSPTLNTRSDHHGGSLERRSRLLFEIIDGIRTSCRPDFQIGLKLSMERFGLPVGEIRDVAAEATHAGSVDYLDIAPHDIEKTAEEEGSDGFTLLSVLTDLPRGEVKLGASGNIMSARTAASALEAGCDFVLIGAPRFFNPNSLGWCTATTTTGHPRCLRPDPIWKTMAWARLSSTPWPAGTGSSPPKPCRTQPNKLTPRRSIHSLRLAQTGPFFTSSFGPHGAKPDLSALELPFPTLN